MHTTTPPRRLLAGLDELMVVAAVLIASAVVWLMINGAIQRHQAMHKLYEVEFELVGTFRDNVQSAHRALPVADRYDGLDLAKARALNALPPGHPDFARSSLFPDAYITVGAGNPPQLGGRSAYRLGYTVPTVEECISLVRLFSARVPLIIVGDTVVSRPGPAPAREDLSTICSDQNNPKTRSITVDLWG